MADFILTTIGGSLTGTSAADNMTFGIQLVDGVPFVATGSLSGAAGNDQFFTLDSRAFFNGIQYAYGNQGNDNITLAGLFVAYGGQDDDVIRALAIPPAGTDEAAQTFFGNQGKDTIDAGGGNDYIEGNQGDDSIEAGTGNDFVYGGKDNDTIKGGLGFDTLYGNEGNDSILGEGEDDLIWGGQGKDTLLGGVGSDTIYGNEDADTIDGAAGSDFLQGGKGNDTITGGGSPITGVPGDTIIGAEGADTLSDGDIAPFNTLPTGNITSNAQYDDIFRYDYGPGANVGADNVDIITGFQFRTTSNLNAVAAANQLTDKISFAVGADAVLAGLNFTASTNYDVNRLSGLATNPAASGISLLVAPVTGATTAAGVFSAINNYFTTLPGGGGSPAASTNELLQVWNFTITYQGVANTRFLYINNGNNSVDSNADMLIQFSPGAAANSPVVADGFNALTSTPAAISDIVFGV